MVYLKLYGDSPETGLIANTIGGKKDANNL